MSSQILLQNGTVLRHDEKDNVLVLRNTDVLVSDGRIAEISQDINKPENASVIDCKDKIISPGLINTHHHMWQSQLKGLLGDCTMLDYMLEGTCIYSQPR